MVVKNQELQSKVDQFWNCFDTSIKINKRGLEGKQRILSVIANDFGRQEIKEKLNVGLKEFFLVILCKQPTFVKDTLNFLDFKRFDERGKKIFTY